MKTFVVGYIDFFDNELKLQKVEADDALSALKSYLGDYELSDCETVDDVQEIVSSGDAAISVIEI